MKRALITCAAAIVLIMGLISCYYGPLPTSNGLTLNVGSLMGTKSLEADETHVWVYLYFDPEGSNSFYDVQEAVIPTGGGTVTFDDIPVGDWKLFVTIGEPDGAEGFGVSRYIEIENVTVTGDDVTVLSLSANEMLDNPFVAVTGLENTSVTGVVGSKAGSIFATTPSEVFSIDAVGGARELTNWPAGYTINGASRGVYYKAGGIELDGFLVNTTTGIVPFDETDGANTEFSEELGDGIKNVLQSGSYRPQDAEGIAFFYQAAAELGGAFVSETALDPTKPSTWVEVNLADVEGIKAKRPVLGFFVTEQYAYFATQFGALRMSDRVLSSGSVDFGTLLSSDDESGDVVYFGEGSVADGGVGRARIKSLAHDSVTDTIYLGTENGVFSGTLTESATTTAVAGLTQMAGTARIDVVRAAASQFGRYAAFLSSQELLIYLRGDSVRRFPFLYDQLGDLKAMAWRGSVLYIAGSRGLAWVDCANL